MLCEFATLASYVFIAYRLTQCPDVSHCVRDFRNATSGTIEEKIYDLFVWCPDGEIYLVSNIQKCKSDHTVVMCLVAAYVAIAVWEIRSRTRPVAYTVLSSLAYLGFPWCVFLFFLRRPLDYWRAMR